MVRMVFFGAPGSGKGTYAQRIAPKLGIAHIATGELVREEMAAGTEIGKKAKAYYDKGELVPDEVVIGMLAERIKKDDAKKGFILDGYPRTIPQVQALEKITKIDVVVRLNVPQNVMIERLSARRQCRKCEKIYNVKYLKPKKEGICDVCVGELFQREDDKPEAIKERLKVYEKQTAPLLEYFKKKGLVQEVKCDKADIPPEIMVEKICAVLGKLGLAKC